MRLIDADALLAEYDREHVGEPGRARQLIEEASTIDAEPVRHARWIEPRNDGEFHCSLCGMIARDEGYYCNAKYCDECGAKMDGNVSMTITSKATDEGGRAMKQKNREKLIMIGGIVNGIALVVKDECVVNALGCVVEQLDEVLEDEEGKDDQG